jgi:hypothetical protein
MEGIEVSFIIVFKLKGIETISLAPPTRIICP